MKRSKRILALALVGALSLQPVLSIAAETATPKDETVYFNLNARGGLLQTTVVNAMQVQNGQFKDYGHYQQIANLSGAEALKQTADTVEGTALPTEGPYYYQGTLENAEMPWRVTFAYALNKKPVDPQALIGASGPVAIHMTIQPNPKATAYFADHYALQVATNLDLNTFSQIVAKDATIATVGSEKQVRWMVLPGESKSFTLTMDAKSFEMEGFTLSAAPLGQTLPLEPDSVQKDFGALNRGSQSLYTGTLSLEKGADQLTQGIAKSLSGEQQLETGLTQVVDGASTLAKQSRSLATQESTLSEGLSTFEAQLSAGQKDSAKLKALAEQQLASQDPSVKALAQGVLGQLEGSQKTLQTVQTLKESQLKLAGGSAALASAVEGLSKGLNTLEGGLKALGEGLTQLLTGSQSLKTALHTLTDGQSKLNRGIEKADGTLNDALKQVPSGMTKKVSGPVPSFVSPKNHPDSVQFVMKTPEMKPVEVARAAEKPEEKLTIWQRFIALFH